MFINVLFFWLSNELIVNNVFGLGLFNMVGNIVKGGLVIGGVVIVLVLFFVIMIVVL